MNKIAYALALFMFVQPVAVAQHTDKHQVISIDAGGVTVDARLYYADISRANAAAQLSFSSIKREDIRIPQPELVPMEERDFFPFTSQMLAGRPVTLTQAHFYTPLFVIGMDEFSVQWFWQNAERLASMKAQGVVIEARRYQDFERLRADAAQSGITLNMMPIDIFPKVYGLQSYPALIVGQGQ